MRKTSLPIAYCIFKTIMYNANIWCILYTEYIYRKVFVMYILVFMIKLFPLPDNLEVIFAKLFPFLKLPKSRKHSLLCKLYLTCWEVILMTSLFIIMYMYEWIVSNLNNRNDLQYNVQKHQHVNVIQSEYNSRNVLPYWNFKHKTVFAYNIA